MLGFRWWHNPGCVSQRWLKEQARREGRNGFDGVGWRWPVRKAVNEAAKVNRSLLRARIAPERERKRA